jgi:hypothetical protein
LQNPSRPHINIWQIREDLLLNWAHYEGKSNQVLGAFYSLIPTQVRKEKGLKLFEEHYKFGIVRNPWDRMV